LHVTLRPQGNGGPSWVVFSRGLIGPSRHIRVHPALSGPDPFGMAEAIEKIGRVIGRSLVPLASNQQQMEETIVYQRKKYLGRKDLYKYDLAKLTGWTYTIYVSGFQGFWINEPVSDSWRKDGLL
jgi:hypothetical protein